MSVGPLGGIGGSVAGSPLAQTTGSETERVQQDVSSQQRRVQSDQKAEAAAGIGETDGEDHETAERDADGRRLWEKQTQGKNPGPAGQSSSSSGQSKDPTGTSGNRLDLTG